MDSGSLLQYAAPAEILMQPAIPFVGALTGVGDRPFRLLSLETAAQEVEPGEAEGAVVAADAALRDALAELCGRGAAGAGGRRDGRVSAAHVARLIERAGADVRRRLARIGPILLRALRSPLLAPSSWAGAVRAAVCAAGHRRAGDLQSGQPAVAGAGPSRHRAICVRGATVVASASASSSRGRSARNSCRCRARW